jgi:hypothetical protein
MLRIRTLYLIILLHSGHIRYASLTGSQCLQLSHTAAQVLHSSMHSCDHTQAVHTVGYTAGFSILFRLHSHRCFSVCDELSRVQ